MELLIELKKFLARKKEIRDYFLDKPYKKKSALSVIGRRLKGALTNWSKGELKVMGGFLGFSTVITLVFYFMMNISASENLIPYIFSSFMILFVGSFLSSFIFNKNVIKIFFFMIIPLFSGFFNSAYYVMGGDVSLYLALFFGLMVFFPVPITVIGIVVSLIRNIQRTLFNPRGKNDVWENLTIEDHAFLSKHMSESDFCFLLKNIKIYDDLPLYEMEYIRNNEIKEKRKEEKRITLKTKEDDRDMKIENYAKNFYKKECE